MCTDYGICSLASVVDPVVGYVGICRAASDADCRQSDACKRSQRCTHKGGVCTTK